MKHLDKLLDAFDDLRHTKTPEEKTAARKRMLRMMMTGALIALAVPLCLLVTEPVPAAAKFGAIAMGTTLLALFGAAVGYLWFNFAEMQRRFEAPLDFASFLAGGNLAEGQAMPRDDETIGPDHDWPEKQGPFARNTMFFSDDPLQRMDFSLELYDGRDDNVIH